MWLSPGGYSQAKPDRQGYINKMTRQSTFIPTSKTNPCPICDDRVGGCRSVQEDSDAALCRQVLLSVGEKTGAYVCTKEALNQQWATYKIASERSQSAPTSKAAVTRQTAVKVKPAVTISQDDIVATDKAFRSLSKHLGLSDQSKEMLRNRGLDDEAIARGCFFDIAPKVAVPPECLNLPGVSNGRITVSGSGVGIPAFNSDGLIVGVQVRLEGEIANKYRWLSNKKKSANSLMGELPIAVENLQNLSGDVWLCEGILKPVVAAHRLGLSVIGASGANFASSPNQLVALFKDSTKKLILAPDGGAIANPLIMRQYKHLFSLLRDSGLDLSVAWWKQATKEDPDIDELESLDGVELISFADFLRLAKTKEAEIEELTGAASPHESLNPDGSQHPEWQYAKVAANMGLDLDNCVSIRTFEGWVTDSVLSDYCVIDGVFYLWQEIGYWQKQEVSSVKKVIVERSAIAYKLESTKTFGWIKKPAYRTAQAVANAYNYALDALTVAEPLSAQGLHRRTFRNGTLNLLTGKLEAKDRGHYVISFIDCDFVPNQECPPNFLAFLKSSFGDEAIATIRAFTSSFLDPTAPYERFPHLLGASGGGKSTLGNVWGSLFSSGYAAGSFESTFTPESRHQFLSGVSLYGLADERGRLSGLSQFYKMVSNESLSGRPLFKSGYTKKWNCRFWVGSVNPLQIEDAGEGWNRRACVIPVKADKKRKTDFNLSAKLETEKGSIISWAIAMERTERDRFLKEPLNSVEAIEIALQSELMGDTVKAFVDACLRPCRSGAGITLGELHQAHTAWCREFAGSMSMGSYKFSSRIRALLAKNHVKATTQRSGQSTIYISARVDYVEFHPKLFVIDRSGVNDLYYCTRNLCQSGGLAAIAEFWDNPTPDPTPEPTLDPTPLTEDNKKEVSEVDHSEHIDWCMNAINSQDTLLEFYELAGFRANFFTVLALMRAGASHVSEGKKEIILTQCDHLERWQKAIAHLYPEKVSTARSLTSLERLEKDRLKKDSKKKKR